MLKNKKKLLPMKVTTIPIVTGAPGTLPQKLVKRLKDVEIRGQLETIKPTKLLRLARIIKKS